MSPIVCALLMLSALDKPPYRAEVDDPPPTAAPAEAPGDPRPIVYRYTDPTCDPCRRLDAAIEAGALSDFQIVTRPTPDWVASIPVLHFPGANGKWYRHDGWRPGDGDVFRRKYLDVNPGATLVPKVQAGRRSATTLDEQLAQFLPDETRLTIQPPRPLRAMLDDGTVLAYSRISGKVTHADGRFGVRLDPPLPTVSVQKFFLRFGATIEGVTYEPTPAPGFLAVDTSRGRYRFALEPLR